MLKLFYIDLLDRGAISQKSNDKLPDIWASIILIISGAVTFIDNFKKLAVDNLGILGVFLPVIFTCIGIIWSIYAISSKIEERKTLIDLELGDNQTTYKKYTYSTYIRVISKFSLLIFILILPFFLSKSIKEILPLPKTIYGYLYNNMTSEPIFDARLRIKNSDGVDITNGNWFTDSKGFYIIESKFNPKRSCTIEVIIDGCDEPYNLPMTLSYEIKTKQALRPTFNHYINLKNCNNEE